MKWQYKVISPIVAFGGNNVDAQLEGLLNVEGSEGWELIATLYTQNNHALTCIYKRPSA